MRKGTCALFCIGIAIMILFSGVNPGKKISESMKPMKHSAIDYFEEPPLLSDYDGNLEFVPDTILVKFKQDIDVSTVEKLEETIDMIKVTNKDFAPVLSANHIFPLQKCKQKDQNQVTSELEQWVKLKIESGKDIRNEVERYKSSPLVEWAQLDYLVHSNVIPNDTYYSSYGTWGQDHLDMYGLHCINVSGAWEYTTGSNEIVVAVIDSGIDYNHEDIIQNMWINEDEVPDNEIDDDGDGFVDNIYGADLVYEDGDPIDGLGHGTHCAGTIGAVGNNSLGVVGVNWQTKIMAVKGLDDTGFGPISVMADCIRWASDQGARVLSNSWGFQGRVPKCPVIEDAVLYAYDAGCTIVFSAGNRNDDVQYYSPQNMEETITVAATDYNDEKAWFTNYGNLVDVCAPGVDILSLRANGTNYYGNDAYIVGENYYRLHGTSMSCPHVSGLVALMLSKNQSMSSEMIETILVESADTVNLSEYIGGRINAQEALQREPALIKIEIPNWDDVKGLYNFHGTAWGKLFDYYTIEYGQGTYPDSWTEIINSTVAVEDGVLASLDTTVLEDGAYMLRLHLVCSDGIYEMSRSFVVNNEQNLFIVDDDGGIDVDYLYIQDAVNDSGRNDSIFVRSGMYYEHIVIDRTIQLTGEDRNTTIIDGMDGANVIVISADFVIIDGFTIKSSRDSSVCMNSDYNIIRNNTIIYSNLYGIYLGFSNHNTIENNNVSFNDKAAFNLEYADYNTISGNVLKNNVACFYLDCSSGNKITDNILTDSQRGIRLIESSNNTISRNILEPQYMGIYILETVNNTITNNTFLRKGIVVQGYLLDQWITHHIENNTIKGKPIRYYKNINDFVVPIDTAQLILANCTNITVRDLNISEYFYVGLQLGFTYNSTITKCLIANSYINFLLTLSANNSIFENTIKNGTYGLYHHLSSNNNIFYHNNFIDNPVDVTDSFNNIYDNGYPSGGNYWDYWYDGVDNYSGPEQNEPGADGIGDTPYLVSPNSQDNYPFMNIDGWVQNYCCADFDRDGDVDLSDFSIFALCFSRAGSPPSSQCGCKGDPDPCNCDLDGDGDVDLSDFAKFALCFAGAGSPPAPQCPC